MSGHEHEHERIEGVPARYWSRLEDGRVVCELCPRKCRLKPGQRGLCYVRAADEKGDLVLTTWGRSSGFCVDPVEKKPLYHFLPGTPVLSFGTAGCNLTCKFCQNWHISKARKDDVIQREADPATIVRMARATGSRSVAFTYNDPVIFLEYALDVADACHAAGIKTIAVTAGYIEEEPRKEFFSKMDAANVDLKGFTEDFYRKLASGHLKPVLDTLRYIYHETDCWLEITTLLIPGHNDSDEEIAAMSRWIHEHLGPDVPLHFSAFYPTWRMKDVPPTPPQTVMKARRIAMEQGLRYVYTGNIVDSEGQNTYCHNCGELLIGRMGYELTAWNLVNKGHCRNCGKRCAGVFEEKPGNWGARYLPVDPAAFSIHEEG